ncbi:MAG: hypothetical protein WDZ64_00700 [Parcubacteria group bacterium]
MNEEQNNPNPNINTEGGSSTGPIVGTIVILAIIALGAFYFWGERANEDAVLEGMVEEINTQDESDDTASIEADLEDTDLEGIDAELNAS